MTACNNGIDASQGEFFLRLDADDLLDPRYLERTVPVLTSRPATGYVAEFTRDVPRVKVITARDVMRPGASAVAIGGTVPMHLSLEMVIPRFDRSVEVLDCTDESGAVCGHITAQGVLAALAAEGAAPR